MMLTDWIVIGAIVLVVGGATAYIIKAKKSGKKCIGCPNSGSCSANTQSGGCSGSCGASTQSSGCSGSCACCSQSCKQHSTQSTEQK